MTARPILFSAPMVRALLEGRKTQTRRTLKPVEFKTDTSGKAQETAWASPRFAKGDRLWVRETYSFDYSWSDAKPRDVPETEDVWYWADGDPTDGDWTKPKPGIHMPRWASRLTLTVTDLRVEQLIDISEADCIAEGIVNTERGYLVPGVDHPNKDFPFLSRSTAREMYAALWDVINGSGAWCLNPWVVAVSFSIERRNIDAG